ncbi:MAG: hypothetical protein IRY99_17730, partial [Isosphaeraceae bacterium]|nr:hypothetical protein [Isosphaeraceae bacterium]
MILVASAASEARSDPEGGAPPPVGMLDLTRAVVVAPRDRSGPEAKAVAMLVEEVERRSLVRWEVTPTWPDEPEAIVIAVGQEPALRAQYPQLAPSLARNPAPKGSEGYRIQTEGDEHAIAIIGNDPRGVLFGVGRLLRELRMARGQVLIPEGFRLATAPRYPLRGHQLGYRPKTNSYDGWDLDQWEQYIRDLIVFGANAIELIPPRSDDAADSPHFPRPPLE